MEERKNTKKKVLVLALILAVLAIITVGSLAWFTDRDTVNNELNFSDKFSVAIYETNSKGKKVKGRTYTELMPGSVIDKNPTALNDGSFDEYLRFHVTINNYSNFWERFVDLSMDPDATLRGMFNISDAYFDYAGLPYVDSVADSVTYTYYLKAILKPNQTATLFTTVEIPGDLDNETVSEIGNNFKIDVTAEAIQAVNLPNNVTNCQQAFALVDGTN